MYPPRGLILVLVVCAGCCPLSGQSTNGVPEPGGQSDLTGASAACFGALDMLFTAIGEESYYRGILYQEVKRALGVWPARVLDMLFFPALHLPSDIRAVLKPGTILFNVGWRSVMTLVFDGAVDQGGLPLAVAAHFWSDLVLVMARWVFYGG